MSSCIGSEKSENVDAALVTPVNHDHTLTCHEINMKQSNKSQQSVALRRAGWVPSLYIIYCS